jgi:hypothetical protein
MPVFLKNIQQTSNEVLVFCICEIAGFAVKKVKKARAFNYLPYTAVWDDTYRNDLF